MRLIGAIAIVSIVATAATGAVSGCGGSGDPSNEEAVKSFEYWGHAVNAANGNLQHVFVETGKSPTQWRQLIAAYEARGRHLATAWGNSPDYVHRFFAPTYRLLLRQGEAFIVASKAALRLRGVPLSDLPAMRRATRAFGRSGHKALHLSDESLRTFEKGRHEANAWMADL